MEESKRKPIMIGIIVVCLVAAGLITYASFFGGSGGISSIPADETYWVKCANRDCQAEYQMSKRDYHQQVKERFKPLEPSTPLLVCKECGKDSILLAEKCQNPACGIVFTRGRIPGDMPDRCPKCKQSAVEESRKARLAERK